jgi:hypothetical protein
MNRITLLLCAATATVYLLLARWNDYVITFFLLAGVGLAPSPVKIRDDAELLKR